MPERYFVSWYLDIDDADDPVSAARKALGYQRDPSSTATVFDVTATGGRIVRVDLDAESEGTQPVTEIAADPVLTVTKNAIVNGRRMPVQYVVDTVRLGRYSRVHRQAGSGPATLCGHAIIPTRSTAVLGAVTCAACRTHRAAPPRSKPTPIIDHRRR